MARRIPGCRVRNRGSLGTRKRCAKVRCHAEDDTPFSPASRQPLHAQGDHRQRLGDVGQQVVARRRERHAAGPAVEQLDAEPFLERVDAVADRARGQSELVRGLGKTFVPGSGFKQPERRQRWNRNRHRRKLARETGPWKMRTRERVSRMSGRAEARIRDHCGGRPTAAQSASIPAHEKKHQPSSPARNSSTMRTTSSGCSMKGMWPAPGMTTSFAAAMRAAIRSLSSLGMR